MKRCFVWLALPLLFAFTAISARAQDSGRTDPGIFAELTGGRVDQGIGNIWGGSAGAYVQGHALGLVVRGTALPSNADMPLYLAVAGPRLGVSLPIFRVYVEAAGGMGHAGYQNNTGVFGAGWGPAWQVDAGVSHGILPHLRWRILEAAYSRIYTSPSVSPVMLSTGLSVHFW